MKNVMLVTLALVFGCADADDDGFKANDDCNDEGAATNPDADELCDGVDNDCDGVVDEDDAVDAATWYADTDEDGFGDALATVAACAQPAGYVADNTDCDDTNGAVFPTADEVCNDIDDDCDAMVDDADDGVTGQTAYYPDVDDDGYGDTSLETLSCDVVVDQITTSGDCDDEDAAINPDAVETCIDGVDTNCDGTLDSDICTACADISVAAYFDSWSPPDAPPPFQLAAESLGMTYVGTQVPSEFGKEAAKGTHDVLVVDKPGSQVPAEVTTIIETHLTNGGSTIVSSYALDSDPDLAAVLDVSVVSSLSSPLPVYAANAVLWDLYESLPNPLLPEDEAGDDGDIIVAVDPKTSEVLATFDVKGKDAAILSTHSGQAIVNGFLPWDLLSSRHSVDSDKDKVDDATEVYVNELLWLLDCTP